MKTLNKIIYILGIFCVVIVCLFLMFIFVMIYKLAVYDYCNDIGFAEIKCEKYRDF